MKQQQEEERLAREVKKKAEEEAVKLEKEKKLALERQKREQERLQKEEEKKQREEERLKKEEEKKRRIKEEKERAAERERTRKEKEEKDRLEKEKIQKAKAEKELKEAKAEKELKEANERLKREAKVKIPSPVISHKTATSSPGIPTPVAETIDDSESRQQVLIEALVGPRPNFIEPLVSTPVNNTTSLMRPPPQLQQQASFMPSHLDILQNGPTSSLLSNSFPLDHTSSSSLSDPTNSPSIMGIFNNRVGSPLESSTSTRQGRSITPIAPIGQPLNGRRVSSVPPAAVGSTLHDMQTPSMDPFSSSLKRQSVPSPFDTSSKYLEHTTTLFHTLFFSTSIL